MSLDYPCSGLGFLSLTNTTILAAHHLVAGSNITTSGSCQSSAITSVDICRVYGVINTTSDSAVKFELWLPDAWYGRFLGVGNGGLGGCIDYTNIDYGTSLNFATIGSDNGHDGDTGLPFYNHPEVIVDYAHRAIHTEALIGKQITEAYYTRAPDKSYYLGCSTGGRQAMQAALLHPDDFDGIIGGAPAADFNHFIGSGGMLGTYIGAPNGPESPNYIPTSLWPLVSREILNQCDGIDGVVDGIITEPDDCQFDPTTLLCANDEVDSCLTQAQVEALVNVYEPLYGSHNQLLYSRYDPGAEADAASSFYFNGNNLFQYTNDWMKYTIYNDSTHSLTNFSVSDVEFADIINPGGVSTWNGDFSCFKERGGKLLTYHGRRDAIIPSGNSKRLHSVIASALPSGQDIDDFYRLFLIPGMNHCNRGPGAWAFGQDGNGVEFIANDTSHNVLLAMVEWVEGSVPPEVVIGVDENKLERKHCLYPKRSFWSGEEWTCL